jgi:hypothetical protein
LPIALDDFRFYETLCIRIFYSVFRGKCKFLEGRKIGPTSPEHTAQYIEKEDGQADFYDVPVH